MTTSIRFTRASSLLGRGRSGRTPATVLAAAVLALGALSVTPWPAQAGQDVIVNPSRTRSSRGL